MRIRSRLLLLVLAALVPALLVSALGVAYIYREEQKFSRASVIEASRALALALERDIERRLSILRTLSLSPALQAGELRPSTASPPRWRRKRRRDHPVGPAGRQLVNTRLPFGTPLPPMLPVERETRARVGNEAIVVSDLYQPPSGLGPHSFAVQFPLRRDGEWWRFLTMASFAAEIQQLLAAQRLAGGVECERWSIARLWSFARSVSRRENTSAAVRASLRREMAAHTEGFATGHFARRVRATALLQPRTGTNGRCCRACRRRRSPALPPSRGADGRARRAVLAVSLAAAWDGGAAHRAPGWSVCARRPARSCRPSGCGCRQRHLRADAVARQMGAAMEQMRDATAELERRSPAAVASYSIAARVLQEAEAGGSRPPQPAGNRAQISTSCCGT
jgi:hypothetical protein